MQDTGSPEIKKVWDDRAQAFKEDSRVSMPDRILIDLEIRQICRLVSDQDRLLDIGCANGYTDLKIVSKKKVTIHAFDNSQVMAEAARQALNVAKNRDRIGQRVSFEVDDIFNPDFVNKYRPQHFDKVLTKRVLINIPTWEGQQKAIQNIHDILDEGKIYIMMESTIQGYENMNRLRERFGIERTRIRWHNNYLDEDKLIPFLKERFDVEKARDFSSTYYVGSRVIQPLLLKAFGREPSYDFFLNRFFARLPSLGNCGIQKLFVLKKRRA